MSDANISLFNNISIETFLKDYWQQKPLLTRQAFRNTQNIITAEELAGLSCEAEISSRIVLEKDGDYPWQVSHGPFDENFFSQLPAQNWSLLVSDVERHLPHTRVLLEPFRFIPDWRIDDLMISYAPPGGSVGPHTDEYDVFLIQLDGCRRWKISEQYKPETLDIPDLKILAEMQTEQEWLLNPGDMLYLPPNVAHHGVAEALHVAGTERHCLTASVGFRAPTIDAITSSYVDHLNQNRTATRYRDREMVTPEHPAEIDANAVNTFIDYLKQNIPFDYTGVQQWLGEYLSDNHLFEEMIEEPEVLIDSFEQLTEQLANNHLERSPYSNFLFSRTPDTDQAIVFVNGQHYTTSLAFAKLLCNHGSIDVDQYHGFSQDEKNMIVQLYNQGVLTPDTGENNNDE